MSKQTFNYHTHTYRCGHAHGMDEQYVKAAIMAGFKELAFTDHMPYPDCEVPGERMRNDEVDTYFASINELKEAYKDKITIYTGFEIEWYDNHAEYLNDMRKRCDIMILGQHCKYSNGYGYDYLCDDEDVLTYTKQIEHAFASGIVTYLAHPDYFMLGRRTFNEVCVEAAHRIASASIEYDIPLEVNLKGLRRGGFLYEDGEHCAYPYPPFWNIISQYGCKCVYGYDAHQPWDLLEVKREELAQQLLEGINLNFVDQVSIR